MNKYKIIIPWVLVIAILLSILVVNNNKKPVSPRERVVVKIDTLTYSDTIYKFIKGKATITQLPPVIIKKHDTVYVYPKAFKAELDTVLYTNYTFNGGSTVAVIDSYKVAFYYPLDSFNVALRQDISYKEVEKTIIKIVSSDLKWYNKPEWTIPIGFVAGVAGTAGLVYMIK